MTPEVAAVLAVIYALSSPASGNVGEQLAAEASVPTGVTGLLLPGHGVVQASSGLQLTIGSGPGSVTLTGGEALVTAETTIVVTTSEAEVQGRQGESLVSHDAQWTRICVASGSARVPRRDEALGPGECLRVEPSGTSRLVPASYASSRSAAEAIGGDLALPPPGAVTLPDVIGDPSEHFADIEGQLTEQVEHGSGQEASACGCSEGGGSGGGLDPSTSAPPAPEPEQGEPGALRVHIVLPRGAR